MNMCKLSMDEESTPQCFVRILSLEKIVFEYTANHGGVSTDIRVGTIDILDFVHEYYKRFYNLELKIHLILGSDTYNDLIALKWKQSERLKTLPHIFLI